MEDLRERFDELEKRVARLEALAFPMKQPNIDDQQIDRNPNNLIKMSLTNKRYQPKNPDRNLYEDNIWFDCLYMPEKLSKATRAIKGVLVVMDLFGEVKFRLRITINDRLEPNKPFNQQNIGFEYNQFKEDHQWMLATKETDMKVNFLITNILYEDGTSEAFT